MDLNEIKNRAKDLLADLTEPRPERDDRTGRGGADNPTEDAAVDPAARTDRLDRLDRPAAPVADPVVDEPGYAAAPAAGPASDDPGRYEGADRSVAPDPVRWQEPAAASSAETVDTRVDPAADRLEHRDPNRASTGPAAGVDAADVEAAGVDPDPARGRHHYEPEVAAPATVPVPDEPARPVADDSSRLASEPSTATAVTTGSALSAAASTGTSDRLVSAERANSYGSRWNEVKGDFVDEPRRAVVKADELVGELLDELGQLFDRQRASIEHDLDNDDVSTEDLRTALQRYRSFFDRLLSV